MCATHSRVLWVYHPCLRRLDIQSNTPGSGGGSIFLPLHISLHFVISEHRKHVPRLYYFLWWLIDFFLWFLLTHSNLNCIFSNRTSPNQDHTVQAFGMRINTGKTKVMVTAKDTKSADKHWRKTYWRNAKILLSGPNYNWRCLLWNRKKIQDGSGKNMKKKHSKRNKHSCYQLKWMLICRKE